MVPEEPLHSVPLSRYPSLRFQESWADTKTQPDLLQLWQHCGAKSCYGRPLPSRWQSHLHSPVMSAAVTQNITGQIILQQSSRHALWSFRDVHMAESSILEFTTHMAYFPVFFFKPASRQLVWCAGLYNASTVAHKTLLHVGSQVFICVIKSYNSSFLLAALCPFFGAACLSKEWNSPVTEYKSIYLLATDMTWIFNDAFHLFLTLCCRKSSFSCLFMSFLLRSEWNWRRNAKIVLLQLKYTDTE